MIGYKKIVFHIGIHKTGTTFLQKSVFPRIEKTHFARWNINIEKLIRGEKDDLIISNESLSGRPWGINNDGIMTTGEKKYKLGKENSPEQIRKKTWIEDFEEKVKGILKRFPKSGIAICFRRHEELINSLYKQYILEGGTGGIRALYDIEENRGLIKKEDIFLYERIRVIEKYAKKKPFVFLYGDLKSDFKKCICRMLNYFGIKKDGVENIENERHNVSKGKYRYEVIKMLNEAKTKNNYIGKIARNKKIDNLKYKLLNYPILSIESKNVLGNKMKNKIKNEYESDWEKVETYLERQR